jgi:hypothetical protein
VNAVAVYCSARDGLDTPYVEAAREVGLRLAGAGVTVVYGGGGVGLMGELASAALDAGGEVIGVIPRSMVEKERAHRGVSELVVVETMHERKKAMSDRAEAFVALPGGVGTLDEIFEAITWNQLRIHDKPIGFLDVGGFYAPLRQFLVSAAAAGFIPDTTMSRLRFAAEPGSVLALLGVAEAC